LILDDLPAMDNANTRRGIPSTHVRYGEATAILAAMALTSLAFDLLTRADDFHAEAQRLAIRELAEAIGTQGLIGGQYEDLESKEKPSTLAQIESIHSDKAAALFRAAVRVPATLFRLKDEEVHDLTLFAHKIGLAFQICDDISDIVEDSHPTNCRSHVLHLGLDGFRARAKDLIEDGIAVLARYGRRADTLRAFAEYVKKSSH